MSAPDPEQRMGQFKDSLAEHAVQEQCSSTKKEAHTSVKSQSRPAAPSKAGLYALRLAEQLLNLQGIAVRGIHGTSIFSVNQDDSLMRYPAPQ